MRPILKRLAGNGWKCLFIAGMLILPAGCSRLRGHSNVQASPEMLIGRWAVIDKDTAAENPGATELKSIAVRGELRYEFKDDHTVIMSVKVSYAMPVPELKNASTHKWKVVEVKRDTLLVEFDGEGPPVKIVFQNRDRCSFIAPVFEPGEEPEVSVLNRLP